MKQESHNLGIAILRVSSARQKDNISFSVQESEINAYCRGAGVELAKVFRIIESAKDSDNRRLYASAIEEARRLRISNIVFYMPDREGRNLTDIESNEKLIKREGFRIHYARERRVLDKQSADSDFMMREFSAVMNKGFVRNLSAKVIDSQTKKAESGWFPCNRPPEGYEIQRLKDGAGRDLKGSIIVPTRNEIEKRRVLRYFELNASNFCYAEIRRIVIGEGLVPDSKVRNFHISQIERTLKNPFFRGEFVYRGKRYKGAHELFVPKHLVDAVDARCGKRGVSKAVSLFGGGFITCASCGCYVVADPKTKRIRSTGELKTYHYYHCSNGKKQHNSLSGMNVSEQSLWSAFSVALDTITISHELAQAVANALNQTHEKTKALRKKEHEDFCEALLLLEKKEDRAYDDLREGILDEQQYKRQLEKIRNDRKNFSSSLEKYNEEVDDAYLDTAKSILELAKEAKTLWLSRSDWEKRKFLDLILSNPKLDGLTLQYDLKKPFEVISKMRTDGEWRPHWDAFRTAVLQHLG